MKRIKLIFLLSFALILILGTTSFASQPSLEEMIKFIDLIKIKQNNGDLVSVNRITGNSTSIATQFLNLTSGIDYDLNNIIYLPGRVFKSNDSWVFDSQGVLIIANNTFSEDLPFLYIDYIGDTIPILNTTDKNGSNWSKFYSIKESGVFVYDNCSQLNTDKVKFNWSTNPELSVLTNNVFFTKLKTASIYIKYSGYFYPMLNNYSGQNYNEYYGIFEEPEEPENPDTPDIPGGNGNTGTITNPSGESTGKVDLSGIENGIGNINQNLENLTEKVPSSGDIKNAQVQGNKDYWGSDINNEDSANELDNIIGNVQDSMSSELESSEIFGALTNAEQGFLNLISGQAGDFKISWPEVQYLGQKLIPAGEINFSQICRENETLKTVKTYTNVIMSFFMAMAIIKYVYNLFLSTLGIDNQFLYEQPEQMTTSYNANTGVTTYRGTDTRGRKFTYRTGGKNK